MHIADDGRIYRQLGKKLDNLYVRAPWNETWHSILKELYTSEEADVVIKMPFTLSTLERISLVTKVEKTRLRRILERLCRKGLVMDLWNEDHGQFYYMSWPIAIGIFEFTMMRAGDNLNTKRWAELFHEYFEHVYAANFSNNEQTSALRVIPIEESIKDDSHTEFFDYEKATSLIENSSRLAIGVCSCRNEKLHTGHNQCDAPLESCSFLGIGAEYAIRNNFAREVSKSEMMDNFTRSKEHDLVFCAVNTRRNPMAICHCCKCCCNFLGGLNKFGHLNCVVTSSFISKINTEKCTGCGKCVDVCPVNALSLVSAHDPKKKKRKTARLNGDICVGCGVCIAQCRTCAIEMIPRKSSVIHPESLFEITMLSSLERGTLQNQLFDNPESVTQEVMRSFMGAFLRLPTVKKTLMSDMFRSTFLSTAKGIAKLQGKGWMLDI
ncbi:MAG TPA: 4Fe-4S dicluster domain-containing protein [Deltaproteobacteria bacterium]|nr:4Fe-4S dicluster domain-containing protein [Deltaproteobacteria bacterium]